MRNSVLVVIAIVTLVVTAGLLVGCQQSQPGTQTPNEKQARLLAAQNADLQKQLAVCRAQIESLRQRHAQEVRQRDEEIAQCKARIEALQKDIEKGIAERVNGVTTTLLHENAKLRQEIEELKANAPKEGNP